MNLKSKTIANPDRVEVRDQDNDNAWVATFTLKAYTVTLAGPKRTLSETAGGTTISITHSIWVRAAPGPFSFSGTIDERWVGLALEANTAQVPDVIGLAMQYMKGAPPIKLGDDLQIAGEAEYGPVVGGEPQENADFNDYLKLRWLYPTDELDLPELAEFRKLDCSGYMRMVWGYRHHLPGAGYLDQLPLSRLPRGGLTLPRRSHQMFTEGPGVVIIPNAGTQVATPVIKQQLRIGDLVFFDREEDSGVIDHVGMYVGQDKDGGYRFLSSRAINNGPTFANVGGESRLDGTSYFAKAFRAARRI